MPYSDLEEAVRKHIKFQFPDDLEESRIVAGNLDKLFEAMQAENADMGCLLNYENGAVLNDPPFDGRIWLWAISGLILIRYKGDPIAIEEEARQVIDTLSMLFKGSHTLGGITPLAKIAAIKKPDPGKLNDVPFYWIPFLIEVLEKA